MSDHPALENFLSAYFHQDWAMEHDTSDAVVDGYRTSESPEQVAATREDLRRLLSTADDDTLGDAVRQLGSEYDPTREGGTWRAWLERVQMRLSAG